MRNLNYSQLATKIQNWLKSYLEEANLRGYILGLSGGIDSAVTASLCVNAVGKKNVIALNMPCGSIIQDYEDAKLIAEMLDIKMHTVDLTATFEGFYDTISPNVRTNKIAVSNIKPRLRMTTLYFFGQSYNYLVAGTGNRSEIAIGYFTKYGDGGVDLEPIGGLYKCEVRTLARTLEIPEKVITKPPSAGLWQGQTDEEEIGLTYDLIDEILYRMDYGFELDEFKESEVNKVKDLMKKAAHKNRMPPLFEVKGN
ncbi:MAG: NAD+ synthase [Candidatus Lokiarchaeota archaeon]|nr:NAD+ synthase [Candidatus Lokiarchaeota archaeon]MBD3337875.1 NAD+ synthase [Candidatus Lokiarchaeota archaeon]